MLDNKGGTKVMAWQKFRRVDTYTGKDAAAISISKDRFNFNSLFAKLAGISPRHKVVVHLDPPSFRIGFEFVISDDTDALALIPWNKRETPGGYTCSSRGVFAQHEWVAGVARLSASKDRRFLPKKDGSIWAIQLCPSFELSSERAGASIPTEANGIYRYLDAKGETVYIGRGRIKQRLVAPERQEWDFAKIKYSVVETPEDRERWEGYWIQRYKEEHGGRLPYYNQISGTTSQSDAQQEAAADVNKARP